MHVRRLLLAIVLLLGSEQTLLAQPDDRLIGPFQLERKNQIVESLPPGQRARWTGILDRTKSFDERDTLRKALASGRSLDDIAWLADQIRGRSKDWLLRWTTLTEAPSGKGLKQQFGNTCGPTTVEAFRGFYDPVYALRLHRQNNDVNKANPRRPYALNPELADRQASLLKLPFRGKKATVPGSKPVSRAYDGPSDGRGIADLLNEQTKKTGLRFTRVNVGDQLDEAVRLLRQHVGRGQATPVGVGGKNGLEHWAMVTEVSGSEFKFYDPWTGQSDWFTAAQIRSNDLDVAGWNRLLVVQQPRRVELWSAFAEGTEVGRDATEEEVARFIADVEDLGGRVLRASEERFLPQGIQAETFFEGGKPTVLLPAEGKSVKWFGLLDELVHVRQIAQSVAGEGASAVAELFERAEKGEDEARAQLLEWEAQARRVLLRLLPESEPGREAVARDLAALEGERSELAAPEATDETPAEGPLPEVGRALERAGSVFDRGFARARTPGLTAVLERASSEDGEARAAER